MRALIVSDIHGNRRALERLLDSEECDTVIFCGDGLSDILRLRYTYPGICFYSVKGNCDIADAPDSLAFELFGKKAFVTHGHRFSARYSEDYMLSAAAAAGASYLFYGHTHTAVHHFSRGIEVVNPGSLDSGYSYAVAEEKDGRPYIELRCLQAR